MELAAAATTTVAVTIVQNEKVTQHAARLETIGRRQGAS
jgi:hypothetical protein